MDCNSCITNDCYYDNYYPSGRPSNPMPFVGLYITIASLVCCFAIIADIVHGVRHKKLWIPCKYFTINAATLTLLAVAVKLPSDLTTLMTTGVDVLAKYDGIILISTSMAAFMPSLGSMSGKDILQNMIALAILVITLCVNTIIQIFTKMEVLLPLVFLQFLFAQFVLLVVSAATIGSTKLCLTKEYDERHTKLLSNVVGLEMMEMLKLESLRLHVKYYWVMAQTGSPVFVMARSATCSSSAILCIVSCALLSYASDRNVTNDLANDVFARHIAANSDYKWSTYMIHVIQMLCIMAGTIPPALRTLLIAISFSRKNYITHWKFTFRIEEYWIASFRAWKQRPFVLHIHHHTLRKIVQDLKIIFLNLCIVVQIIIIFWSKFILLISYLFMKPSLFFFYHCGKLKGVISVKFGTSNNHNQIESKFLDELSDLKRYVLLLEGELELSERILRSICISLDQVIKMGAKQKPMRLLKFLTEKDPFNLNNLLEFDSDAILSIHSVEPFRCWSLSITSLVCVAIALPTIVLDEKRKLLNSVGEGFSYVRHVEKGLDTKKRLENAGKAADVVWNGIELKNKWLGNNILGKAVKGKDTKEVLGYLVEISQGIVKAFKESTKSKFMENPLNWPENVIAATSLYRVSQTILLQYENTSTNNLQLDEVIFKKILAMVSDIFCACLTNLPLVIMGKCYSSTIEKREKNVEEASQLLGASEDILKFLERHVDIPSLLASDDAAYIDNWRASIREQNAIVSTRQMDEIPVLITRCASI